MKPLQMYLQKEFGDPSYHRQPGNDHNVFINNAPWWPHKDLKLKNERNTVQPIFAKDATAIYHHPSNLVSIILYH